jgi:hypothetical protein
MSVNSFNNNDVLVLDTDEEEEDVMIQEGGSDNEINETENDFEFKEQNKQTTNSNTIQQSQGEEEVYFFLDHFSGVLSVFK